MNIDNMTLENGLDDHSLFINILTQNINIFLRKGLTIQKILNKELATVRITQW